VSPDTQKVQQPLPIPLSFRIQATAITPFREQNRGRSRGRGRGRGIKFVQASPVPVTKPSENIYFGTVTIGPGRGPPTASPSPPFMYFLSQPAPSVPKQMESPILSNVEVSVPNTNIGATSPSSSPTPTPTVVTTIPLDKLDEYIENVGKKWGVRFKKAGGKVFGAYKQGREPKPKKTRSVMQQAKKKKLVWTQKYQCTWRGNPTEASPPTPTPTPTPSLPTTTTVTTTTTRTSTTPPTTTTTTSVILSTIPSTITTTNTNSDTETKQQNIEIQNVVLQQTTPIELSLPIPSATLATTPSTTPSSTPKKKRKKELFLRCPGKIVVSVYRPDPDPNPNSEITVATVREYHDHCHPVTQQPG